MFSFQSVFMMGEKIRFIRLKFLIKGMNSDACLTNCFYSQEDAPASQFVSLLTTSTYILCQQITIAKMNGTPKLVGSKDMKSFRFIET